MSVTSPSSHAPLLLIFSHSNSYVSVSHVCRRLKSVKGRQYDYGPEFPLSFFTLRRDSLYPAALEATAYLVCLLTTRRFNIPRLTGC